MIGNRALVLVQVQVLLRVQVQVQRMFHIHLMIQESIKNEKDGDREYEQLVLHI